MGLVAMGQSLYAQFRFAGVREDLVLVYLNPGAAVQYFLFSHGHYEPSFNHS